MKDNKLTDSKQKNKKNNLPWWEKSVEYEFILQLAGFIKNELCNSKSLFLQPLAGDLEKSGDGLFGITDKIVIIEFKRSNNDLTSEYTKYDIDKNATKGESNFNDLKEYLNAKELFKNAKFHKIIYGELNDEKQTLSLKHLNYFDLTDHKKSEYLEINTFFEKNGTKEYDIIKYLPYLLFFKTYRTSGGGGKAIEIIEDLAKHTILLSIDKDGTINAKTLVDFFDQHKQDFITAINDISTSENFKNFVKKYQIPDEQTVQNTEQNTSCMPDMT